MAPVGGSVGADRVWAQNRISNFFKAQQAAKSKAGAAAGAGPEAQAGGPHVDAHAALAPTGGAHPAQVAPHAAPPTLEQACIADPGIASHKWQDLVHEAQPRAVAMRPQFIAGATERMHKGEKPLDAMRNEVAASGQKYLCLGAPVPETALVGSAGISRVVDLPSAFSFNYVKESFKADHRIRNLDEFLGKVRDGSFHPERDMEDSAVLRGRAEQTWWFATNAATAIDLDKLRKQLFIEEYPSYAKGAVRLDMPAAELKTAGIQVHKPTAFDGMMQGTDVDAMWAHSKHEHWGLTKHGTPEAVMKMMVLGKFKHRSLVMPGAAVPRHEKAGEEKRHG